MYGRGTCDMKAGVAACVVAAEAVPDANVLLTLVADEENDSLGTLAVLEHLGQDLPAGVRRRRADLDGARRLPPRLQRRRGRAPRPRRPLLPPARGRQRHRPPRPPPARRRAPAHGHARPRRLRPLHDPGPRPRHHRAPHPARRTPPRGPRRGARADHRPGPRRHRDRAASPASPGNSATTASSSLFDDGPRLARAVRRALLDGIGLLGSRGRPDRRLRPGGRRPPHRPRMGRARPAHTYTTALREIIRAWPTSH